MQRELRIFETAAQMYHNSAQTVCQLIKLAIKSSDRCTLVLSGGSTPKKLYELLADKTFSAHVEWSKVFIFWGDERCVPPEDPQSNFKLAYEFLLSKIASPSANIFRIRGENHPSEATNEYERTLKEFFHASSGPPAFDIILLGLGEDGHTASLFPGSKALTEKERWVVDVTVPKPPSRRITLTLPVLNNAHSILFVVTGESKAKALREIVENGNNSLPAALVQPVEGDLLWMADQDAAKFLHQQRAMR